MTHDHKRTHWYLEGLYSMVCGFLFGATNAIVGHPFDTIKTKMQAQTDFINTGGHGYLKSVEMVYQRDGLIGFYRGVVPPFFGSTIFRSLQFATYEAVFTKCETHPNTRVKLPLSGGIEMRVLLGAFASATIRAVIECPFEYAKVRRQTGQTWKLADGYTGFRVLYIRTLGLMSTYFCLLDSMRRHTNIFNYKVGQFLGSGVASMVGFWVIWPFEVLKNQAQAGSKDFGGSTYERALHIYEQQGIKGFFRGIIPGSQSVFLRNGAAMVVMQYAQKRLTEMGLRD